MDAASTYRWPGVVPENPCRHTILSPARDTRSIARLATAFFKSLAVAQQRLLYHCIYHLSIAFVECNECHPLLLNLVFLVNPPQADGELLNPSLISDLINYNCELLSVLDLLDKFSRCTVGKHLQNFILYLPPHMLSAYLTLDMFLEVGVIIADEFHQGLEISLVVLVSPDSNTTLSQPL